MAEPVRAFPVSMILTGEPVLVVGGGRVAARKIASLLEAGARVSVVTREACDEVARLAVEGRIALRLGEVGEADLEEPVVVIGATDDHELHRWLYAECRRRRVPVNIVDITDLCTFHVPACIRRGPLTVALATGGEAPALAKRLRRLLEGTIGEEWGRLAELMGELRGAVREFIPEIADRTAGWRAVVEDEILLGMLREERTDEARTRARELLGVPLTPDPSPGGRGETEGSASCSPSTGEGD